MSGARELLRESQSAVHAIMQHHRSHSRGDDRAEQQAEKYAAMLDRIDAELAKADEVEQLRVALQYELSLLERYDTSTTHWDCCENSHPRCAAIKRILAALAGGAE